MRILELPEEERSALCGELPVAVPFSLTVTADGELTAEIFPSLRADAEAFLARFSGDAMFSAKAAAWAAERFGGFLTAHGYELSEDSFDFYINYRLTAEHAALTNPDVMQLFGEDGLENLTECDFDALNEFGHLCFAAVTDGKIAAAAYTNEPVGDACGDVEIGVETAADYRGRGYGSACVAALVRELSARGLSAVYECASKNTASAALAEKLGGAELSKKLYIVGF